MLVSKRKRYLSGPDWVIATLDYLMKRSTCSGNMSQIVLFLENRLDGATVREHLDRFTSRYPVLRGRVTRDLKLSPYWKIPERGDAVPLEVTDVEDASEPAALLPLLARSANSRFRDESHHLGFHLFSDRSRSALAMTFDHRLFDARGAETFLELFRRDLAGESTDGAIAFASSCELTRWKEKFLAGRNVNRRIIALVAETPRSLPLPSGGGQPCDYRLLSFGPEETAAIRDRAWRQAGYLMESPFILAVVTRAMHRLLSARSATGSCYLVPVTTDLRPGRDPLQETFFNHVSYLFYRFPGEIVDDMPALITAIKEQMYDQVKSGLPADLARASLLMRIAPLGLLGKLLYAPLEGKMASFVFSHLGKSSFAPGELLGAPVTNLIHMPRVPVPPGLGFFSTVFGDRLNLVISSLEGLVTDEELDRLEADIRDGFGLPS